MDSEDVEAWKNGQINTNGEDFSLRTNIDKIEVSDFKKWEDARAQDFIADERFDFDTNVPEFANDKPVLTINKRVTVDAFFVHSFAKLRAADGITNEMIEQSLAVDKNRSNVFKAGEASGASGSFFFFSHDKAFVIKTMTSSERKFFF